MRRANPSTVAALPPKEIAEAEPVIAATEPPPIPVPEILPPDRTEPLSALPHKPVVRQPGKTVVRRPQPRAIVTVPTPAPSRLADAPQAATAASQYPAGQSGSAAAMPATVPGHGSDRELPGNDQRLAREPQILSGSARQRGEEITVTKPEWLLSAPLPRSHRNPSLWHDEEDSY
jgi:hypothetical protein